MTLARAMDAPPGRLGILMRKRGALVACLVLLAGFAAVSWSAVVTKSPTADEPLHAAAGFVKRFHLDFRVDPEDPPLLGYWAMLPHARGALQVDLNSPAFDEMLHYMWRQWTWVVQTLFRTPDNDADRFINRSRAAMLVLGVALGVLVALWAHKLAGPVAAVTACALYALDPNFLAHAPLVKNDVAMALLTLALAYAAWRAGERVTMPRALAVGLILGAAVNMKFSGLLLGPVLGMLLLVRALVGRPWIVAGRIIASRARRVLVSVALLAWAGLASVGVTWLCYGERYEPTPNPAQRLNIPLIAKAAARTELIARNPSRDPTDDEIQNHPPSCFTRAILFADRHRLLPQSWLAGLLDTYATTRVRSAFLLGEVRREGWWYYFPLAILFKTPLATLAALAGATVVTLILRARRHAVGLDAWAAACLALPLLAYALTLVTSNLNLGLRHALPLYPFAYVLLGVVVARMWRAAPRATGVACAALLLGLGLETARAFPNYIPFFNVIFEPRRLHLLGDSNLDWGQDLKLLARWRREHPGVRLYVCYFGGVDPRYYVPDAVPLRGTDPPDLPQLPAPDAPGVIAVSATHLQGIYRDAATSAFYRELAQRQQPANVLGESIYLFEWPPTRAQMVGSGN